MSISGNIHGSSKIQGSIMKSAAQDGKSEPDAVKRTAECFGTKGVGTLLENQDEYECSDV